ncbi:MAG: aspartate carbamoyltransferase [Aigarchaeota archaeon]|nr:aspartate carbamoyltransferase [Aigarchaeota archaeon]MDW8092403.1 aspartate carbamoyltransferase [Nitrososphaerota archaeon]
MTKRDVVSAIDFTNGWMMEIFRSTDELREEIEEKRVLEYARGRFMVTLFTEPSTRTRLSFTLAMKRLGGEVIDFGTEEVSSIAKGESLEDTVRTIDGYDPDVMVIRSKDVGAAKIAAELTDASVINAGDGWNEHPTQALLDVYTIQKVIGKIDGIRVAIMGDLRYGRTASSLSYVLSKFKDVKVHYVAPPELQIREEVISRLSGVEYEFHDRIEDIEEPLDVLYVTRVQWERIPDRTLVDRLRGSYMVTPALLRKLPKIPIILHPLPRLSELPKEIDRLPEAKYFDQAKNGIYVRAALLRYVLGV